jgi:DNA-binding helix-hairpin-helix protein with protein kinase domain
MFQVYDASGRRVTLGKTIGAGGEGTIYEVSGDASLAAKIYDRKDVEPDQEAKLAAMLRTVNPTLLSIAAWPTSMLYDQPRGHLKGFLMPRVVGHREIHELYSPAHRKQQFPEADWQFLIHVARNLAAAVHMVHEQGHVIGDMNQKGILVQPRQGTVQLIDCDSFQIRADGRWFRCTVGVRDFTPPELQGVSFHDIERTPNHDNFGLAVFCFQLLFMGRHPFAGRYHGSGEDSLERAIREYRFAYSQAAATKQMSPPPHTLCLEDVSPGVAGLFERAFEVAAVQNSGRPAAHAWIQALNALERELRSCSYAPIHKYHTSLAACPWCKIERATGSYLFVSLTMTATGTMLFNLEAVWVQICAVSSPGAAVMPVPSATITPTPLPPKVQRARVWRRIKICGALALSGFLLTVITTWGFLALLGIISILVWAFRSTVNDHDERAGRQQALVQAQVQWEATQHRWQQEASAVRFVQKRRELEEKRTAYQGLAASYQRDRQRLDTNRRTAQLKRFLERHFLDQARIPDIGPGRKATLASYGIETAADITRPAVRAVPGIGPVLTKRLLDWRKDIETQFRFDPHRRVDPADVAALDQRYVTERRDLETGLWRGRDELQQLRTQILRRREEIQGELSRAAMQLAQAKADVSLL